MKILVFTDLHIHPHKKSSERLEDCLNALTWAFKTAKKRKISNMVFLGDLFHDRQKIDVLPTLLSTRREITWTKPICFQFTMIWLHLLYYVDDPFIQNEVSSVFVFGNLGQLGCYYVF